MNIKEKVFVTNDQYTKELTRIVSDWHQDVFAVYRQQDKLCRRGLSRLLVIDSYMYDKTSVYLVNLNIILSFGANKNLILNHGHDQIWFDFTHTRFYNGSMLKKERLQLVRKRNVEAVDGGKRQSILCLAGKLFLKQGYAATSVRQIARELDISLGLVTYYFPTKRDLAFELLKGELSGSKKLLTQYVDSDEDPICFSGALTKLQYTILSSPNFVTFYHDVLRDDIYFDVIIDSGIETYQKINQKYNLQLPDDHLVLYGNFISSSMERTLVLYAEKKHLEGSVPDMIFKTYMGRIYGTREFLDNCCRETDQIVARVVIENPQILTFWLNL